MTEKTVTIVPGKEMEMTLKAVDAHEAPFIERLKLIGEAIGYGRSVQVLEETWTQKLIESGVSKEGARNRARARSCDGRTMHTDDELVPIALAARRLRVTKRWLTAQAEAGEIPCLRAENRILVSLAAVRETLLARAQLPPDPTSAPVSQSAPLGGETEAER